MLSDLTFLTNEPDRKLSVRINDLLARSDRFDCLVGYFYLSGFDLIRESLEPCNKIRILVGLQTDQQVYEATQYANRQRNLDFQPQSETIARFKRIVLTQLEHAEETVEVESAIEQLVRWCQDGKVEIRAYDKAQIHAKVYIFSFDKSQINKGHVITGSSNLSARGLRDNLEFNVELKDSRDYDFAVGKFDELWRDSVEVSDDFVRTVSVESHLAQFSPYELYLKFLYEYFQTELNQPRELEQDFQPEGFVRFQYQHDAVLTAKRIVEEYNGVFLADVVGLGKTYMAAMLARELDGRSLVIAPPALIDRKNPGAWQNVFNDFGVRGFHVESVGKLDQLLKIDLTKFKHVFIDEAHRFRNEDNETYAKLHRICRLKQVILVTATPFNNRPNDLLSQLKLFQDSRNSTLPNLPNLDNFFSNLNARLRPLNRVRDREEYLRVMRENARDVRERILKHLMVRRTRSEISHFYDADLRKQNLRFPEVEAPQSAFYELSDVENEVFTRTIERITKQLTYSRYRPLTYLPKEKLDENVTAAQFNLAGFMKVLLVKRLESSFEAFRKTLGRFISAYEQFIKSYEQGSVYVSKKKTALIFELIDAGEFEAIEALIEAEEAEHFDASSFTPDFIRDLNNDLHVLQSVQADWKRVHRDPKWEKLKLLLQMERTFQDSKLLLFSESKETADYLSRRIRDELGEQPLLFSGSSTANSREQVIENFDARVRRPKDEYRILITTDALSEGVSLHRANVVVNYDIPWNPTRMMQRIGRINRVDTKFERIFTYTFFPSKEGNDEIGLREAAEAKIEAFIEMLGIDARLLTENEEIKSFNLFARITSKEALTGESDEEDSELKYLRLIRDVQQNQKDLFAKIKTLPRKARAARILSGYSNSLITYFRWGKLDKFYLATPMNSKVEELDFLTSARTLESNCSDKMSVGKDFFALLKKNQSALDIALQKDREAVHAAVSNRDTATKVLRRLHIIKDEEMRDFTDTEDSFWQDVIQALKDGAIAKRTVNKIWTTIERMGDARSILETLKKNISLSELASVDLPKQHEEFKPREVILSEYFI